MKIGIFGGAFNPVHYAHLAGADQVRERLGLDKVVFVPSGIAPHRKIMGAEPHERYEMVSLAIRGNRRFEISDIEIKNNGSKDKPAWSIDTAELLAKKYGRKTALYFIVGSDEALALSSWKESEKLLNLVRFVVMTRPGYEIGKLSGGLKKRLKVINITALDISASVLRERIKKGLSVKYLVPPPVEAYIRKHGLYRL